ncbi:MAG: hypothetical protein ACQBVK_03125, partial [Candidatus Phytoplasma sp. TWB_XP]
EYIWEQLKSFGFKEQDLKDAGYISIKEFENLGYNLNKLEKSGYNLYELRIMGYISILQIINVFPSYDLNKLRIAGYEC